MPRLWIFRFPICWTKRKAGQNDRLSFIVSECRSSFQVARAGVQRIKADNEFEFFGLAILIEDQTLVSIHLLLRLDSDQDQVSWLELKLGEKLTGEPGEMGKRGMRRDPYSSLDSVLRRMYRIRDTPEKIDWRYKATFGERRIP